MINKNLSKYKLVLFDFDDTLCIHTTHSSVSTDDTTISDNVAYKYSVLTQGIDTWKNCKRNAQMAKFINLCIEAGAKLGLISHTDGAFDANKKIEWVKRQYGPISLDNYCVGTREQKLLIAHALCNVLHCKPCEILMVDDIYTTLNEFEKAGFDAATPMEVACYVDEW